MSAFDYYSEATLIGGQLADLGYHDWKQRIDDAIAGGSTGTEILMALRWTFQQLRAAHPTVPAALENAISSFIENANRLLA